MLSSPAAMADDLHKIVKRVEALMAKVGDAAATEEEQRSSALIAVKLIKQHELLRPIAEIAPKPADPFWHASYPREQPRDPFDHGPFCPCPGCVIERGVRRSQQQREQPPPPRQEASSFSIFCPHRHIDVGLYEPGCQSFVYRDTGKNKYGHTQYRPGCVDCYSFVCYGKCSKCHEYMKRDETESQRQRREREEVAAKMREEMNATTNYVCHRHAQSWSFKRVEVHCEQHHVATDGCRYCSEAARKKFCDRCADEERRARQSQERERAERDKANKDYEERLREGSNWRAREPAPHMDPPFTGRGGVDPFGVEDFGFHEFFGRQGSRKVRVCTCRAAIGMHKWEKGRCPP